jgi:hypothetical protein
MVRADEHVPLDLNMALARKTAPPPAAPTEFEAAQARWRAIRDRRRAMIDRLEGARSAHDAAGLPFDELPDTTKTRIIKYLDNRRMSLDRIRREISEIEDSLQVFDEEHAAEAEVWKRAKAAEEARLVATVRPAHREVVIQIARAVQSLSDAVEAERELLAEAHAAGASLPAAGTMFGSLSDSASYLARWRATMVASGVL